jgi:hypothetical protein
MCTEFLLALLYLVITFIINFFLFKLLKSYIKTILYLTKIKNIFKFHNPENLQNISFLHLTFTKDLNIRNFFLKFNKKLINRKDILVIGNFYKFIGKNIEKNSKQINPDLYYYQLLENQYLSNK